MALLRPYGPPAPSNPPPIDIVEAFDPIEIEYASIRRHAAMFDQPHVAVLEFTGPDRISFLNRMLTQEMKDLAVLSPSSPSRRAFWLNRKGRIDADLLLIPRTDRLLALCDAFAAKRARSELDKYIITEDVALRDATADWHSLSLHGPAAAAVLARAATTGDADDVGGIQAGQIVEIPIASTRIIVSRQDWAGTLGLELLVPSAFVSAVYDAVSTPWSAREHPEAIAPSTDLARRIGWHALNIARIEAGTAMYMLDFGPDSLPHETGDAALASRVSFKKGCYLGQEIVARMQSLGKPKQKVVSLRVEAPPASPNIQAVTGTPIVDADTPEAAVVGAVTSSAFSPLLGQQQVALAMVKHSHTAVGTPLWLQVDMARLPARVG